MLSHRGRLPGFIQSIDANFGVELMFPDTTIAWIGWDPFLCVLEFPQFVIGRIASERFVFLENSSTNPHRNTTSAAHPNHTVRPNTTEEGATTTRATSATTSNTPTATREYVTIGGRVGCGHRLCCRIKLVV